MMKGQLSYSVMGIVLATAALGFIAVRQLPALPSREAIWPILNLTPANQQRRIYCDDGDSRQYSNTHHGYVCPTEYLPRPGN